MVDMRSLALSLLLGRLACLFARARTRTLRRLSLSLVVVALTACNRKSDGPEHRRVGALEVAVLEVEQKKSVSRPGIKYEPAPGQQYIRVALHAKSEKPGDKLEESDLVLIGSAGTKASAEKGWGQTQLSDSFFRILEYWFALPKAEGVATLQLKGTAIALAGVGNAWPFRVAVERVTLVDALTISGGGADDRVVQVNKGEKFVVLDVSFEPLLPRPKSLPPGDEQHGDLQVYTDKLSPDVSVRLGALRVVGGAGEQELFVGALAPAGQDRFFGAPNMNNVAIASDKPKIACRLAGRIGQDVAQKLNALHFGSVVAKLPPATISP
jgi:hypothetical protein